jgi:hypothetical protein
MSSSFWGVATPFIGPVQTQAEVCRDGVTSSRSLYGEPKQLSKLGDSIGERGIACFCDYLCSVGTFSLERPSLSRYSIPSTSSSVMLVKASILENSCSL